MAIKTGAVAVVDRTFSPRMVGQLARALEATGVVDDVVIWDQLTSWWPTSLWRSDVTPLAQMVPDPDSFHDAFQLAAFAVAATERMGVTVSTDAIRRGPAELMQTMMTLASATEGSARLFLGAGELKQTKPFGHKRGEGLARLEDLLRIFRLLWDCDRPVDFDGNIWKLRDAWLGETRPHRRPKFVAMGGGPRFMELAARYADGWVTDVPGAVSTPEQYAELAAGLKREVERQGRDPDNFEFGVWAPALLHEEREAIDAALCNPLLKFIAAAFGRLNMADWEREGIESAYPKDWHYALRLLPVEMNAADVDEINSRVSKKMVERSFVLGNPNEVAQSLLEYRQAGATWFGIFDFLPSTLSFDEAATSLTRSIDVYRCLKSTA